MSTDEWTISYNGKRYRLRGFTDAKRARAHTKKHFLANHEAWHTLCDDGGPNPNDFKKELRGIHVSSAAHADIMNRAAARYEDVVAAHGRDDAVDKVADVSRQPNVFKPFRFPAVLLVSKAGYLAVFHRSDVSDLLTAFRPHPRGGRGTPKRRHFLAKARDAFARRVAENELYLAAQKRARRGHRR